MDCELMKFLNQSRSEGQALFLCGFTNTYGLKKKPN